MSLGMLSMLTSYTRLYSQTIQSIECTQQTLCAWHSVFHFVRYGRDVSPTGDNTRLNFTLGNNTLALYAQNHSLLLAHKGTANPLAEGCERGFFSHSQNLVILTLSFGEKEYVFKIVPSYFERLEE
ncbi:MAG: hypothetical protein ACUVTO_04050 [Candidatus Caldatribacteriaceae bacterium]